MTETTDRLIADLDELQDLNNQRIAMRDEQILELRETVRKLQQENIRYLSELRRLRNGGSRG